MGAGSEVRFASLRLASTRFASARFASLVLCCAEMVTRGNDSDDSFTETLGLEASVRGGGGGRAALGGQATDRPNAAVQSDRAPRVAKLGVGV